MILLLLACTAPKPSGDDSAPPVDSADTADSADSGDTADSGDDGWGATRDALRRSIKQALRSNEASGAQVAVWLDGEIVWSEGIGTRDPATEDPVLPTTLFEIGSDTKKLTALALLQQVEAGRATLDTTVAEVLPDWSFPASPDWAATTTVHELLSHQGGLFDYTPFDDVPADSELEDRWYGRMGPEGWAMVPSGVTYNYSNPNFTVAGLITERLDGTRAWADIVEQDLFAPMGLTRTFARESTVVADGDYAIGTGYYLATEDSTFDILGEALDWRYDRVPMEEHPDNGFTRPAGLVWSTAEEVVKMAAFLVDGDPAVLADDLRERVVSPQVPMYPRMEEQQYGYGVIVLPDGYNSFDGWMPTPLWMHGGNTLSFTSTFCVLPELRVAVSILSNGYGDAFTEQCIEALEAFVTLPAPTTAPELFDPVGDLDAYTGSWLDPHTVGRITVTTDGADLYVDAPDLEALGFTIGERLTAYGADVFTLLIDGVPYELIYTDGADGEEHRYLVDRLFVAERSAPEAVAPTGLRGLPAVRPPGPRPPIAPGR